MYINGMFNYDYISQQAQQKHHQEQVQQVIDSGQKLKDFLDSTEKIEIPYQSMARDEFCAIIFEYINRHRKM